MTKFPATTLRFPSRRQMEPRQFKRVLRCTMLSDDFSDMISCFAAASLQQIVLDGRELALTAGARSLLPVRIVSNPFWAAPVGDVAEVVVIDSIVLGTNHLPVVAANKHERTRVHLVLEDVMIDAVVAAVRADDEDPPLDVPGLGVAGDGTCSASRGHAGSCPGARHSAPSRG